MGSMIDESGLVQDNMIIVFILPSLSDMEVASHG